MTKEQWRKWVATYLQKQRRARAAVEQPKPAPETTSEENE